MSSTRFGKGIRNGLLAGLDDRDLHALTELMDLGADLSTPRQIHHFMTVPSEDSAADLAQRLDDLRYDASSVEDATSDRWFVIAARDEVVDADTVAAARAELAALLAEFEGAAYERWDADLTEDEDVSLLF